MRFLSVFIISTLIAACAPGDGEQVPDAGPAADPPSADRPRVVFLGTSLTAGYGLAKSEAYPTLIQLKIDSAGLDFQVVNAGVSGETSAGGLRRIDWLLREPVAALVIELGANDGLRGLSPDALAANLRGIIDHTRERYPAARILLIGMEAPPNLGAEYTSRFRDAYRDVAAETGVALLPFLLEGVGGEARLNQADGIHPTAAGQRVLAENVWEALAPLLLRPAGPAGPADQS